MITVCNIVTYASASAGALSAIRGAERVFIQSALHPSARALTAEGKAFIAMDELFEDAADFDALHEAIAARLKRAGDCVYVMTGSLSSRQLAAIRAACGSVRVLPGVTLFQAAFPEEEISQRFPAHDLPDCFDPGRSAAVEEIDSLLAAGAVKLALMEFYPEDWPVRLRQLSAEGSFAERAFPLYELDRQGELDASCVLLVPAVPFFERARYDFSELIAILKRLRARDGCPWDREQTHESLKAPLLEECYELLDAIDSGDDENMLEELGDVLMQTAFHAVIASEQGRFNERDVATGVVKKLIYRHPHVFGAAVADTSEEVLKNWETLKQAEKGQRSYSEAIRAVPRNLPALTLAAKVQKKAASAGFDWPDADAAFYKIAEETEELKRAMAGDGDAPEEMGDVLFAAVNVSRLLHQDPELLLRKAADKFAARFARMEALARAEGLDLTNMSLPEMDAYWDRVKKSPNLG